MAVDAGGVVNLGSALGSKALAWLPPLLSLSFPPGKLQLWVWTSVSPSFRGWDGLPRTQGLASHTVSATRVQVEGACSCSRGPVTGSEGANTPAQPLRSMDQTLHHCDFPGGPVVKTPRFHCRGLGLDPWSGN